MGQAIHQFWLFFTTLFTAAEKLAKTTENLATITEEMSATYLDETRYTRAKQTVLFDRELLALK